MYNRDNQYHLLNLDFYTANLTQIHTQNKKKEGKKTGESFIQPS